MAIPLAHIGPVPVEELVPVLSVGVPAVVMSLRAAAAGAGASQAHDSGCEGEGMDFTELPADLPVPRDDGAADHLPGAAVPHLSFQSTLGETVWLDELGPGRHIIYVYPLTGRPGHDLPEGWDEIPGARGCTTEACSFRDHREDLRREGATSVHGLSSQTHEYQAEMAERLALPFGVWADPELTLAAALDLPTFEAAGQRLYRRLTLVVRDGVIEHVFYPVFPPDQHATEVLAWLSASED